MKTILTFLFMVAAQASLCADLVQATPLNYSLKTAQSDIEFTAFKTTAKIGVKGWFKSIEILSGGEGASIPEAIHDSTFSIPVSSLFTKDAGRDLKIKNFFFGIMKETASLSGQLTIKDESTGIATIKMNNVSAQLPFTYEVKDKIYHMKASMNIDRWLVQEALSSLNAVCKELHKGPDGITRTWPDVELNITVTFK